MRILIFFALLFLVSCMYIIYNHRVSGINVELWNKVKVGDDREKVVHTLGSPTLVSKFDENVWYYYGSKSLQISFNQNGEITDIREIYFPKRWIRYLIRPKF
uniref:Outer membrane protein assembly factor BamE n=1 Tax=Wolbachia endosymbiont of Oeneis ivallda TaxID=3171168 RepID=A0AAU7YKH0_9RICK